MEIVTSKTHLGMTKDMTVDTDKANENIISLFSLADK